jgi:glycosyl transferase family 25
MSEQYNIPIFVISLQNSDRRAAIGKTLENYSFQFIDAICGKKLSLSMINDVNNSKWVKKRYKRKLTTGELGCALSHIKAYNKIISEKIEWALILEDDIKLNKELSALLESPINTWNKDHLYILGAQDFLDSKKLIIKSRYGKIELKDEITFHKTISSYKYIYRTASYLIHRETAKKIISFTKNNFCLADDWFIFKKNSLFKKIYISDITAHPEQTVNQSLLEQERKENQKKYSKYNLIFLKNIRNNLRKLLKTLL